MRHAPTGHLLLICKKYTENARAIRWHCTGELFLHAGKSMLIQGRKHGIKFRKSRPLPPKEQE